jgi:ribosomal protein L12E/L44/L45/RPP1/RPP2
MELRSMERFRGASVEEQDIEDLINDMHGREFMEAHGLPAPADEADMEDGASCDTRKWTDEHLDCPVHEYTKTTVRELVYAVMRICAGSVKATTMDELIKAFNQALTEGHGMPRSSAKARGRSVHTHDAARADMRSALQ